MNGRTVSRAEQRRRVDAVTNHVAIFGLMCPGWGVPRHAADRLEACHVQPRFGGGERGPLTVLCHACNNRQRYGSHHTGGRLW